MNGKPLAGREQPVRSRGIFIPWPGLTILITLALAVGGPLFVTWNTARDVEAGIGALAAEVAHLSDSVRSLDETVTDGQAKLDKRIRQLEIRLGGDP